MNINTVMTSTTYRNSASHEKQDTNKKTHAQRRNHECGEVSRVAVSHEAHGRQFIGIDRAKYKNDDGKDRRYRPGNHVVHGTVPADRLWGPVQSGDKKPEQGEHYPPDTTRYPEVVYEEKYHGTVGVVQTLLDEDLHAVARVINRRPTGDRLPAGDKTNDVGDAADSVAEGNDDGGSGGKTVSRSVDEKREDREGGRDETEPRPGRHPVVGEMFLIGGKSSVLVAAKGAGLGPVYTNVVADGVEVVTSLGSADNAGGGDHPADCREADLFRGRIGALGGSLHAHVRRSVLRRKLGTVQCDRPRKSELVEYGLAAMPDRLAERATRTNRIPEFFRTHRKVCGTEEERKPSGAAVLYERTERHELLFGVDLRLVADQVRHPRRPVPDRLTHLRTDRFAVAYLDATSPRLTRLVGLMLLISRLDDY